MPSLMVMRAAAAPLVISDTFDRSNTVGSLGTASDGGAWTQSGTSAYVVSGNQAATGGPAQAGRLIPGSSTDMTLTIDNFRPSTAGSSQIYLNAVSFDGPGGAGACYWFEFDSGGSFGSLRKTMSGVTTNLSNTFINPTVWTGTTATLELKRVGNLLTVKVNGVLRFSATDTSSPLSSVFRWCGFRGQQTAERWDNFIGTSVS